MKKKKHEKSQNQQESANSKLFPYSILTNNKSQEKKCSFSIILKEKVQHPNQKHVNFSDASGGPLHVIFEVKPIIYPDVRQKPLKKTEAKGCYCLIH